MLEALPRHYLTAFVKAIIIFPPGNKCEALRLGVHLILIFYYDLLLGTEIIFFILMVGGGLWVGVGHFLVL